LEVASFTLHSYTAEGGTVDIAPVTGVTVAGPVPGPDREAQWMSGVPMSTSAPIERLVARSSESSSNSTR